MDGSVGLPGVLSPDRARRALLRNAWCVPSYSLVKPPLGSYGVL